MEDYNLTNHPEHAQALGSIVAGWSCLEGQLIFVAVLLMRGASWQTEAALYTLATNRARLNMLRALSERMLGREKYRTRLLKLIQEVEALALKRNSFVHGQWHLGTNSREAYITENEGTPQRQYRKVQSQELQSLAADIMKLLSEVQKFTDEYGFEHQLDPKLIDPGVPEALSEISRSPPESHEDDSDPRGGSGPSDRFPGGIGGRAC